MPFELVQEILLATRQHLWLVLISVTLASLIALPTGVLLTRFSTARNLVLTIINAVQTIPSLALFGLLIPVRWIGGIGTSTAIVALVLYALLPMVRNTVAGIESVDPKLREAAVGLGMSDWQLIRWVDLPLARRTILAGVRTALVTTVGTATIAAAIGAGGLGDLIFRGVASVNANLLWAGAIPAAIMALTFDGILALLENNFAQKEKSPSR
jgi:osmoprotectant transport system permease protein